MLWWCNKLWLNSWHLVLIHCTQIWLTSSAADCQDVLVISAWPPSNLINGRIRRQTWVGDAVCYWNGMLFEGNSIIIQERTFLSKFLTKTIHSSAASPQVHVLSAHLVHAATADGFLPCVTSRPTVQVRNHHIRHRTWRGCNHVWHSDNKVTFLPLIDHNRFVVSCVTKRKRQRSDKRPWQMITRVWKKIDTLT
jgi:hypothetical protein